MPVKFDAAKPVWLKGRELEMNVLAGFSATVEVPAGTARCFLRVTGSSVYRIFVNGEFAGHGPARAGHGSYRVDEWNLMPFMHPGTNFVAMEVAGYNSNSYYLLDQPSFLQAEVILDGRVVASTGSDQQSTAFAARQLPYRVQKVQRTSFQRPFCEVYRMTPGYDEWRKSPAAAYKSDVVATTTAKSLLPRRVGYPRFNKVAPVTLLSMATIDFDPKAIKWHSFHDAAPDLKSYPKAQLEAVLSTDLESLVTTHSEAMPAGTRADAFDLKANQAAILDFERDVTGFVGLHVTVTKPSRLFLAFDELLSEQHDVDPLRFGLVNGLSYTLQPGDYQLESLEPYTFRYLKVAAVDGAAQVTNVYVREYANDECWTAQFASSDRRLNLIFDAAVQTFRQNSPDIFMDCPHRERAGWLCDSFFTARTENDLCSSSPVEKNFLENFAIATHFPDIPDGMLPMCYPSDHMNKNFIPNWAMWFVVQLEEYAKRTGDMELVKALEPRVMKLVDFFKPFLNSDGLLEKLPAWVFVEWSKANDFVQDVNYPSNMLYAGMLDSAARLYGKSELHEQAEKVRETIRKQSFDGNFFVDNAIRKDGKLEVTNNRTETCQYYAFFFDVATSATHQELWKRLESSFGPSRDTSKVFPEVHPSNAFIGFQLRYDLLGNHGVAEKEIQDIRAYFLNMAEQTGTLWEHSSGSASRNHGFASHVGHLLYRDMLGVRIDKPNKTVTFTPPTDVDLEWCEGRLPVDGGFVSARWWKEDGKIKHQLQVPSGYVVK